MIAHLRHWLLAGNAHRLHSPFLYQLYTTVLRPKAIFRTPLIAGLGVDLAPNWQQLVHRLIHHWQPSTITTFGVSGQVVLPRASERNTELLHSDTPAIIIVSPNNRLTQAELDKLLSSCQGNTCVVYVKPYGSGSSLAQWKRLAASLVVTASVDMHQIGLLFCRPNQAKEHFRLR